MSIGGSASEQESFSESWSNYFNQGSSSSGSFIDPNQQGFLDFLRNTAQNNFGSSQAGMSDIVGGVNNAGNAALGELGALGNTQQVIDAQLTGLRSGLGELQQQGLNQIGDNAANSGAFGGARHGLAESSLRGEIGEAFTRGYGDIIANANRQSIDANNSVIQGGGQLLGNKMLGDWGPLQALAGIIGDPTILTESESSNLGGGESGSISHGSGESGRFGFGFK